MPPPLSPAELPLTVLLTMVTPHQPPEMPPPKPDAELPLIVLLMSVTSAGVLNNGPLIMPPPSNACPAELPLNVLSKTVRKPAIFDTPGPKLSPIMLSAIVIEPRLPTGSLGG